MGGAVRVVAEIKRTGGLSTVGERACAATYGYACHGTNQTVSLVVYPAESRSPAVRQTVQQTDRRWRIYHTTPKIRKGESPSKLTSSQPS